MESCLNIVEDFEEYVESINERFDEYKMNFPETNWELFLKREFNYFNTIRGNIGLEAKEDQKARIIISHQPGYEYLNLINVKGRPDEKRIISLKTIFDKIINHIENLLNEFGHFRTVELGPGSNTPDYCWTIKKRLNYQLSNEEALQWYKKYKRFGFAIMPIFRKKDFIQTVGKIEIFEERAIFILQKLEGIERIEFKADLIDQLEKLKGVQIHTKYQELINATLCKVNSENNPAKTSLSLKRLFREDAKLQYDKILDILEKESIAYLSNGILILNQESLANFGLEYIRTISAFGYTLKEKEYLVPGTTNVDLANALGVLFNKDVKKQTFGKAVRFFVERNEKGEDYLNHFQSIQKFN